MPCTLTTSNTYWKGFRNDMEVREFLTETGKRMLEQAEKAVQFLADAALDTFQQDYERRIREKYGIAKPFADDDGDVTEGH